MSSNWNLVLKSANLAAFVDNSISAGGQQLSPNRPFSWVCANRLCREKFMRYPFHSEYCPECNKSLKAGRGDLLDPVMYQRCQDIIAQEKAGLAHAEPVDMERAERVSGRAAWRALIGLPPLASDYDVDPEKDFEGLKKVVGVVLTSHERKIRQLPKKWGAK